MHINRIVMILMVLFCAGLVTAKPLESLAAEVPVKEGAACYESFPVSIRNNGIEKGPSCQRLGNRGIA